MQVDTTDVRARPVTRPRGWPIPPARYEVDAARFAPLQAVLRVRSCRIVERGQDKGDRRTELRQSLSASRAVPSYEGNSPCELCCRSRWLGQSHTAAHRPPVGSGEANGLPQRGRKRRPSGGPARSVFLDFSGKQWGSSPDGYCIANVRAEMRNTTQGHTLCWAPSECGPALPASPHSMWLTYRTHGWLPNPPFRGGFD